jgi:U3 small nucleolar RNA-associated protein 19
MPDKMPSLLNEVRTTTNESAAQRTLELKNQADVKAAEKRILSSTENLNEILSLITLVDGTNVNMTTEAASSLAKIFMRFRKHGKLTLANGVPRDSPQAQIVNWLNERYRDFVSNLLGLLGSDKTNLQLVSLTLSFRLVKDETCHKTGETIKFSNRTYSQLVDAFLQSELVDDAVRNEMCDKYLNQYYDLQFYFLQHAGKLLQQSPSPMIHRNVHQILLALKPLLPSDDTIPEMFTPLPGTTSILLPSSYKVAFQSVWLAHLRHPLDSAQVKQLLLVIHKQIIPFMNKPQLLMDWLTDSYNSGASHS